MKSSFRKTNRAIPVVLGSLAMMTLVPTAMATPYASGIQLNGASSSFVLNEDADSVDIVFDGGATTVNMGALSAGTHTFDETLGTTWEIVATKSAPAGWTQISDDSLTQSKYYSPRGVTVDTNPLRSTFGQIIVAEALGGSPSAGGRTTTDGLYIMSADQGDSTGQGDAGYAGTIDWTTGGSSSPFKVSMNKDDPTGQDSTIYISDWSDGHSGIWTADALNPSAAFNELLDNTGRDGSGIVLAGGGVGPAELHGSVPVSPWVEGTGANRTMYTVDEDVRLGNILQYDIGLTTTGYTTAPIDRVTDGSGNILNGLADLVRDEDGSWWIAQYRYTDDDVVCSLSHWADGSSAPSWTSGPSTVPLDLAYGSIDILDSEDLLVMGTRGGLIYVLDISNPSNPTVDTITHSGSYIRDVSFDIAGNIYAVSSSSETLRIYSPGGYSVATTGSDGFFLLVPEPSVATMLVLGGIALGSLSRRK